MLKSDLMTYFVIVLGIIENLFYIVAFIEFHLYLGLNIIKNKSVLYNLKC